MNADLARRIVSICLVGFAALSGFVTTHATLVGFADLTGWAAYPEPLPISVYYGLILFGIALFGWLLALAEQRSTLLIWLPLAFGALGAIFIAGSLLLFGGISTARFTYRRFRHPL